MRDEIRLDWSDRGEASRYLSRRSHHPRQNRSMLEREADETTRQRCCDHLLNSFPKRIDIGRTMQMQQWLFHRWIDNRSPLYRSFEPSLHSPLRLSGHNPLIATWSRVRS